MAKLRRMYTVEYSDFEMERIDAPSQRGWKTVARCRYSCDVEVVIELDDIARVLGTAACKNKTGKSRDGFVVVKRAGKPKLVSRTPI